MGKADNNAQLASGYFFSQGSSVNTTTEVELPGPTLVKALTKNMNSVPISRSLCVVKLVARSVVFNLVSGCDESVGL